MEASTKIAESVAEPKHLNVFERWLLALGKPCAWSQASPWGGSSPV